MYYTICRIGAVGPGAGAASRYGYASATLVNLTAWLKILSDIQSYLSEIVTLFINFFYIYIPAGELPNLKSIQA
jgi:hypothetical protein